MTANKVEKIKAFKKLLEVAQSHSVELYKYVDDFHKGSRYWPVKWEEDLGAGKFKSEQDRQNVLNKVLDCFVYSADFPLSMEQMKKEKDILRLVLDAGANPNHAYDCSHSFKQRIFDICLARNKNYAALEIAKTDGFLGPENVHETFEVLSRPLLFFSPWDGPHPTDITEEDKIKEQNWLDREDLVYTLFQKGIYPQDIKVFEKLVPIVLSKDPNFFKNKKQQVVTQLKNARTPVQIFNALMGRKGGRK